MRLDLNRSGVAVAALVVAALPAGFHTHIVSAALQEQPTPAAPVQFRTRQVSLSADSVEIEVAGRRFSPAGVPIVNVESDPGIPNRYTTLEITWRQQGVEMRLYLYFGSDGRDWWIDSIRTYNGQWESDWVGYSAPTFRIPLGSPFAGDLDLTASGTPYARVRASNVRLQPFLPPPACQGATTAYVLDAPYDQIYMRQGSYGFNIAAITVLDASTCSPAPNSTDFVLDWELSEPGIAGIRPEDGGQPAGRLLGLATSTRVTLVPGAPGKTALRVTARLRATGEVVASLRIPVQVG